jgi:predicted  nucleic acid-binding Zn-ribbon protein
MKGILTRLSKSLEVVFCLLALAACPQDQTALQGEAIQLKKQTAKLESVIQSLQEGNKVLQQQIDRLNQEARETEASYEKKLQEAQSQIAQLANTPKKDLGTIHNHWNRKIKSS